MRHTFYFSAAAALFLLSAGNPVIGSDTLKPNHPLELSIAQDEVADSDDEIILVWKNSTNSSFRCYFFGVNREVTFKVWQEKPGDTAMTKAGNDLAAWDGTSILGSPPRQASFDPGDIYIQKATITDKFVLEDDAKYKVQAISSGKRSPACERVLAASYRGTQQKLAAGEKLDNTPAPKGGYSPIQSNIVFFAN